MISVLVCSVNPEYQKQVRQSVESTIGVPFEWLVFENRENRGLCHIYNQLAVRARFDLLCFIHEDIIFQTQEWGRYLVNQFDGNPQLGMIGVAGSKYKSAAYSGWYTGERKLDCANILHRYPDREERIYFNPASGSAESEVVCIDGVFMCVRKSCWQQRPFNEAELPGFHFYDIDFSLGVAAFAQVLVTYQIDIVHITRGGDFGDQWVHWAMRFHDHGIHSLPCVKLIGANRQTERRIQLTWLNVLKRQPVSWSHRWRWVSKQNLLRYPVLYFGIARFFLYGLFLPKK